MVVSTVHLLKQGDPQALPICLDGRAVSRISAFLREGDFDDTPINLTENLGIVYEGVKIYGAGFTFDDKEAAKGNATPLSEMHRLIEQNPHNAERIKPYLGGSELNTDPQHAHHRFVIDFEDFPLKRDEGLAPWAKADDHDKAEMLRMGIVPPDYPNPVAADWPELLEIVERMVKPERDKIKDKIGKRLWWQFLRSRDEMRSKISSANTILILSRVSAHFSIAEVDTKRIYSDSCAIITDAELIPVLSSVHEVWARLLSSSMKDDMRYSSSECFRNFAMPENIKQNNRLNSVVRCYLDYRASIMQTTNLGLTGTYNRFHNLLDRKPDITELRRLHAEMDDAVLRAYGWDDLADMAQDTSPTGAAPRFLHQSDEPEFAYQKRYHWPAWFRDKVLAKLLELNRERAAAEVSPDNDGKLKPKALQLDHKGPLI